MFSLNFTNRQEDSIRLYIEGRSVIDLGAGCLNLAMQLKRLGASSVLAVDEVDMPFCDGIETQQKCFIDVTETLDVAFLSRPINRFCEGLNEILDRHEIVIYLGSNLAGSACGSLELFQYLVKRNPLAHILEPTGTMLIYSKATRVESLYAEEIAALDAWNGGDIMTLDQAKTYNSKYR